LTDEGLFYPVSHKAWKKNLPCQVYDHQAIKSAYDLITAKYKLEEFYQQRIAKLSQGFLTELITARVKPEHLHVFGIDNPSFSGHKKSKFAENILKKSHAKPTQVEKAPPAKRQKVDQQTTRIDCPNYYYILIKHKELDTDWTFFKTFGDRQNLFETLTEAKEFIVRRKKTQFDSKYEYTLIKDNPNNAYTFCKELLKPW